MNVISRKKLNEFAGEHPDCRSALDQLFHTVKTGTFANVAEARTLFPHADKVGKFTVFNFAGNKGRLITAIHYNRGKVYIQAVLTHTFV